MVATIQNSSALATEQSQPDKLAHAAQQFEAILLNQLLGSLQRAFCSLGEEKKEAGSDQYQFLGLQALASGVAAKGGFGIADMIVRNLKSRHISDDSTVETKKPL
jgi:Rod binding domain-containing protein